jgi:RimJ/RimL family protein N-acetyltransferase
VTLTQQTDASASEDLFTGQLVRLTAPRPEDSAQLAAWAADSSYLTRVDTDLAVPRSPADFDRPSSHAGSLIELRVRRRDDDALLGFAALLGIEWNNRVGKLAMAIVDPASRGRGYGADALALLLRYAFEELNLDRVGLEVISSNDAAIRLYERAGFVREGVVRRAVLRRGKHSDKILMGMLREEWNPSAFSQRRKREER